MINDENEYELNQNEVEETYVEVEQVNEAEEVVQNESTEYTQVVQKNSYKTICLVLMLLLFGCLGYIVGSMSNGDKNPTEVTKSLPATTVKITQSDAEISLVDIISVAENSVVEIATETVVNGSIMRQFIAEGAGSGVIIREEGYIITA